MGEPFVVKTKGVSPFLAKGDLNDVSMQDELLNYAFGLDDLFGCFLSVLMFTRIFGFIGRKLAGPDADGSKLLWKIYAFSICFYIGLSYLGFVQLSAHPIPGRWMSLMLKGYGPSHIACFAYDWKKAEKASR